MHNFDIAFLRDGTATCSEEMHQATLLNVAAGFGRVLTCAQLRQELMALAEAGHQGSESCTKVQPD